LFPFWRNFAHKKTASKIVAFDHQNPAFSIFVARIPAEFHYLIFFEVTNDLEKREKAKKKNLNPKKNLLKLPDF
jgi:hypothetical protein